MERMAPEACRRRKQPSVSRLRVCSGGLSLAVSAVLALVPLAAVGADGCPQPHLQVLPMQLCWQMLVPQQPLQSLLSRFMLQLLAPPQSLQSLRPRLCWQMPALPQPLQLSAVVMLMLAPAALAVAVAPPAVMLADARAPAALAVAVAPLAVTLRRVPLPARPRPAGPRILRNVC